MRWIQYPTEEDRKRRRNGVPREGQQWADAPTSYGPRRKWVVTTGGHGEPAWAIVVRYDDTPGENYALADWPGAL